MPRAAAVILSGVPDDLTSTVGVVALCAAGAAAISLLLCLILALRMRRSRNAQRAVLGENGNRDLVTHAEGLQASFDELRGAVQQAVEHLDSQIAANERRLDRAISKAAVVRYDAYNEMSGRQSSSMALLDENGHGRRPVLDPAPRPGPPVCEGSAGRRAGVRALARGGRGGPDSPCR